nr:mannose-P-dolichol utilization defect 1 protein homolog 2-like [Ipomoea batatas]
MELKFLGMDFSCALGSLSKGEFPEKDCLLPLISKLLGYAIVAASTTVKLPQILKILRHRSVSGLSVVAFELEVVGYTIALAYCLHKGLPFSAYGEYAFLLVQAIILVATIYYFSQPLGTKTWVIALLCHGFCARCTDERNHLEPNYPVSEANPKEGEENRVGHCRWERCHLTSQPAVNYKASQHHMMTSVGEFLC